MISQTVDNLPKGQVIVYEHSAMNETHRAHVRSEFTKWRITADMPLESAADTIGKAVSDLYLKKYSQP